MVMDKPRFTLWITCYNFENYIREAVESALAQTYEPLDIIVSDDCSTDRSWDIIQETVAAYRGPHHVILNRNDPNIGFAANLNKLSTLARTEWIVNQSGDDISLPTRVEKYAALIAENPKLRCIGSWYEAIDAGGCIKPMPKEWRQNNSAQADKKLIPHVIGVVAAYHTDVFRVFGPMSKHVWNEDFVLPLRAKILGEVGWVDEILVQYRFHDMNMSGGKTDDQKLHVAKLTNRFLPCVHQAMMDICVAEKLYPDKIRTLHAMRKAVEANGYIKWLSSNWVIHPEWRGLLLCDLLFSFRHLRFFFEKCAEKAKVRGGL